ncbi:MAG: TauD/TfdA family dioxygenase, partial [Alphaproteobacteria bacterium]
GRGFAVIRGLPTEGRSRRQNAIAFWGIATYFGRAVSQNAKGHLLGHVKNLGADINSATGRGYNSASKLGFHSDSCDMFGLCYLHAAKSGGEHYLCSSVAAYNMMLERRPDLVKELFFSFYRTRRGEVPAGEEPWTRQPVFSVEDGYFAARGAGSTIERAQRLLDVPKLTPAQIEAIEMYNAVPNELAMEIDFELGDIYFVNNHVALHSRTHYQDWPEPERRRHLFRLWMSNDGERPLHPEIVRDFQEGITVEGTVLNTPMEAA